MRGQIIEMLDQIEHLDRGLLLSVGEPGVADGLVPVDIEPVGRKVVSELTSASTPQWDAAAVRG